MLSVQTNFVSQGTQGWSYQPNIQQTNTFSPVDTHLRLDAKFAHVGGTYSNSALSINQSYAMSLQAVERMAASLRIKKNFTSVATKNSVTFGSIKPTDNLKELVTRLTISEHSALSLQNSLNHSLAGLSQATEHLATGRRLNQASDDAAGLQMAIRLQANITGMKAALYNIADGVAMLQTADGALAELTNIVLRHKELIVQSLNGVNSAADRRALDDEYQILLNEAERILTQTRYGGRRLFDALATSKADKVNSGASSAVLTGVTFQIGASAAETLNVGFNKIDLSNLLGGVAAVVGGLVKPPSHIQTIESAKRALGFNQNFSVEVSSARAKLGASVNRLTHTSNNLNNVVQHTSNAVGKVMDADIAAESAIATKQQMQVQLQSRFLFQTSQNSGFVAGLLQTPSEKA